jgi:hypothetical protein
MRFRNFLSRSAASITFVGFCILLSLPHLSGQASKPHKDTKQLPKFEDYPVSEEWQGPASPVQLNSREERLFRTYLTEASKKKADFANHYRFVMWGCGTQCVGGALIDLGTGKVFQPPLASQASGEEHWIFCTNWDKAHGLAYHTDSRLFILPCGYEVYYFTWEADRFRQVARVRGTWPSRTGASS